MKDSYKGPEIAFKFTERLVHLFHRTSSGFWFHLDTIHIYEPELEVKFRKLQRNFLQLGSPNLDVIIVFSHEKVEYQTLNVGNVNTIIRNYKFDSFLRKKTKKSGREFALDWYFERGVIQLVLLEKCLIEVAIEFAQKYEFIPQYVVSFSRGDSNQRVSFFWNSKYRWNHYKKKVEFQLERRHLQMNVAKIPNSSIFA